MPAVAPIRARLPTPWLLLLYLGLVGLQGAVHDVLIDTPLESERWQLHVQLIEQRAPAPAQYRILVPQLAEALRTLGVPFRHSYRFLHLAFTLISALLLHVWLRRWMRPAGAVAGVLFLFAVLPLSYFNYVLQPMDISNLAFLLAALELLAGRHDGWLFVLLPVAMLNRETAIFIVGCHFLVRWDELSWPRLLAISGGLAGLGLGTYAALRLALGVREYYADAYYLGFNSGDPLAYLYAAFMLGPFAVAAWWDWAAKPKLLRRISLTVPFFVMLHWSMTIMREPRLWLPVVPMVLAPGLLTLMRDAALPPHEEVRAVRHWPRGWLLLGYGAMLALFAGFLVFFYGLYAGMHLQERAQAQRFETHLRSAELATMRSDFRQAIAELESAKALMPNRHESHCRLGLLYDQAVFDAPHAIASWERCLELEPAFAERPRIEYELRKLRGMR